MQDGSLRNTTALITPAPPQPTLPAPTLSAMAVTGPCSVPAACLCEAGGEGEAAGGDGVAGDLQVTRQPHRKERQLSCFPALKQRLSDSETSAFPQRSCPNAAPLRL